MLKLMPWSPTASWILWVWTLSAFPMVQEKRHRNDQTAAVRNMFSVLHRWTPWLKRSKLNCRGKLKIEMTDCFHMFQKFYSKLWSSVTAVLLPLCYNL